MIKLSKYQVDRVSTVRVSVVVYYQALAARYQMSGDFRGAFLLLSGKSCVLHLTPVSPESLNYLYREQGFLPV
jgi:hypothetical protein